MKVFKFGGASLKNAEAIRNMSAIVLSYSHERLIIVVSAMGKTTNALEKLLREFSTDQPFENTFQEIKNYHLNIINDLFTYPEKVTEAITSCFESLTKTLQSKKSSDAWYDAVVSIGEIISSTIVHHYLLEQKLNSVWVDARQCIITDDCFRDANIHWEATREKLNSVYNQYSDKLIITQGFIGATASGTTTSLGREGSDFTAAIMASCLQATSVTIWKDVPGVMNADPKRLPAAIVFPELPFKEAAEMTYYGASVIHPKTIKPLALNSIPLHVKSFDNPSLDGTKIHECEIKQLPPLIVFKDNQCLISCKVTDYTFVNEQQLSQVFQALSDLNIKINVMQNSAISFSFCVDFREDKISQLIDRLKHSFEVYYNTGLTLITVKNYTEDLFELYRKQPGVLLEQSSRSTLQVLIKMEDAFLEDTSKSFL